MNTRARIAALLLAISTSGLGDLFAQRNQNPAGSDIKVPWSDPDAHSVAAQLLDRRLSETMQIDALQHIRRYLSEVGTNEFPNALLKVLNDTSQIGWDTVAKIDPKTQFAGGTISLAEYRGFVRLAAVVPLTQDQLSWLPDNKLTWPPRDRVYRLELELDGLDNRSEIQLLDASQSREPRTSPSKILTVFCHFVPKLWLTGARLRQPATFRGFAIRTADRLENSNLENSNLIEPRDLPDCLITDQPIWSFSSDTVASDLQPTLLDDHYTLGMAGWNLSWIDLLAQRNQGPLSGEEQHAFYSMLRTSRKLANKPSSTIDTITPMVALKQQKESIAKLVRWRVRLVKGAEILVASKEARSVLGAEHYFQLDGFVELDGQRVKYSPQSKGPGSGRSAIEFEGEFPITLVSSNLPLGFGGDEALRSGRQAWEIGQYAIAEGIFFRLWSFHSERLSAGNSEARQVAPLVVLTSLTRSRPPETSVESGASWLSYALCAATIGCLSIIWYLVLFQGNRRRRKHG